MFVGAKLHSRKSHYPSKFALSDVMNSDQVIIYRPCDLKGCLHRSSQRTGSFCRIDSHKLNLQNWEYFTHGTIRVVGWLKLARSANAA
jgi:hypothetical protein